MHDAALEAAVDGGVVGDAGEGLVKHSGAVEAGFGAADALDGGDLAGRVDFNFDDAVAVAPVVADGKIFVEPLGAIFGVAARFVEALLPDIAGEPPDAAGAAFGHGGGGAVKS